MYKIPFSAYTINILYNFACVYLCVFEEEKKIYLNNNET